MVYVLRILCAHVHALITYAALLYNLSTITPYALRAFCLLHRACQRSCCLAPTCHTPSHHTTTHCRICPHCGSTPRILRCLPRVLHCHTLQDACRTAAISPPCVVRVRYACGAYYFPMPEHFACAVRPRSSSPRDTALPRHPAVTRLLAFYFLLPHAPPHSDLAFAVIYFHLSFLFRCRDTIFIPPFAFACLLNIPSFVTALAFAFPLPDCRRRVTRLRIFAACYIRRHIRATCCCLFARRHPHHYLYHIRVGRL